MAYRLVLSTLTVVLIAIPISRSFEYISPGPTGLVIGGFASMLTMPILVWLIIGNSCNALIKRTAMFFSIFNFASSIDVICALENDGYIYGYMSTYLKTAEPYLNTSYGTAICYWDGTVHLLLTSITLWDMYRGRTCWREAALLWFGTFWMSMLVLLGGTIIGGYAINLPILLNVPYLILPLAFIVWTFRHTSSKKASTNFSVDLKGAVLKYFFFVYFIFAIGLALLRGMAALNANRELVSVYLINVEKHIMHPSGYCRMTVLLYMFYFVPFYIYALCNLISNKRTPLLRDLSMIHAGAAANAQVGYIGQAFVAEVDQPSSFQFDDSSYSWTFWSTNLALFVVPILFFVYNCAVSAKVNSAKPKDSAKTNSKPKGSTEMRKMKKQ